MKAIVTSTCAVLLCSMLPPLPARAASDVGSAGCGGVQSEIQARFGDEGPQSYKSHGAYIRAVAKVLSRRTKDGEITDDCRECILSQFVRRIGVADQQSCGPDPTAEPPPEAGPPEVHIGTEPLQMTGTRGE